MTPLARRAWQRVTALMASTVGITTLIWGVNHRMGRG